MENTAFAKKVLNNKKQPEAPDGSGVIIESNAAKLAARFIQAIGQHRFWDRESGKEVPA